MNLERQIRVDLLENFRLAWLHMGGPGATWTGAERVTLAAEARSARGGGPGESQRLPGPAVDAARAIAASPSSVRRTWIESLIARGLEISQYVEIVGIVSRLVATDTFFEAMGLPHLDLPDPSPGLPSGDVNGEARSGRAWVPMAGPRSITQALSLVPAEHAELARFHGPMYLTFEEMDDPQIAKGLSRPQMELVAARTSALNECFY